MKLIGANPGKVNYLIGNDHIWVGGSTSSLDFPLVTAYQSAYGGGPFDAFPTRLSSISRPEQ
jgi:hypothetical protein